MRPPSRLLRSYLYAPATRPDRLAKARASGADAVVGDLEDAVAATAKDEARASLIAFLDDLAGSPDLAPPGRPELHVRINRLDDGYHPDDLAAAVRPGLDGLRLPKAEDPDALAEVADRVDRLERDRGMEPGHVRLYPLVESALGLGRLAELARAHPRVAQMAFGSTDLLSDLGIPGEARDATLAYRSAMVLHSRLADLGPPIDSVHTQLDDEEGLRSGTAWARSLGFFGKSVIHPRQLAVVHEELRPTPAEVDRARRVVHAFAAAEAQGQGGLTLDGAFVDIAVVHRAQALLADLDRDDPAPPP